MSRESTLSFFIGVCFVLAGLRITDALEADAWRSTIAVPLTPRPQFGTYPPDCGHLYNNGQHRAWADCMGAGYVSPTVARQIKRDDI